jgi:hypothetical protein
MKNDITLVDPKARSRVMLFSLHFAYICSDGCLILTILGL